MILPQEIIFKILSFTDLDTINNFRKINKNIIDDNINFIFLKLCKIYPFLKYNKEEVISFKDFENTWNMEQYENQFDNYIYYIKEFDTRKKNIIYDLITNNLFHENILFHAVNNLDNKGIKKFKKLCHSNQNNYFNNYIRSFDLY